MHIIIMTVNKIVEQNIQKINFKCSVCGNDSWMQVDLSTYVVSIQDLICDDHYNEDGDLIVEAI